MSKLKIKFGFFSILIIFSLIISFNKFTLLSLLAAAIHEFGHLIASKLFGIRISELNFGILGARLKTSSALSSYIQEILLCMFGPLFNFLSALTVYIVSKKLSYSYEEIDFFIISSLVLGILNLLPIRTFDGGRILESLLSLYISTEKVFFIVNLCSFTIIFILWCISVYFLLIYTSSLGLFIFSLSLFVSLFLKYNV